MHSKHSPLAGAGVVSVLLQGPALAAPEALLDVPMEALAPLETCAATVATLSAGPLRDHLPGDRADQLGPQILMQIAARLTGLPTAPNGAAFPLDEDRLQRQICAFETWKAEVFVRSGVFPKRWFGYLDGQWDTRADELVLREVVDRAVPLANAELAARGHAFRLTDQEVIATWLAEGGTLLLGHPDAAAGTLDPIMDIGLDSLVRGFGTWAPLVATFDAEFGSDIGTTVVGDRYYLNFDLTESILGTIVMLCDERAILARKLEAEGRRAQHLRPLDEQFILGSLHYNSGLLFSDGRVAMIRDHDTADYLVAISEKNRDRRPVLPVDTPAASLALLASGRAYPAQWTSWNAIYHVLQRYSSWQALALFTDWFEADGELAAWHAPAPVYVPATPLQQRSAALERPTQADRPTDGEAPDGVPQSCACLTAGATPTGAALLTLGLLLLRRRA